MAGRGSRLRPHTLTIPKPLLPIAGKPIVERLVEDLQAMCPEKVENIGFIIGDFGKEIEQKLLDMAARQGAKGHIFYQDKPLGTAHAILCARPLLEGKTVIAFADTLFDADFKFDAAQEACIITQKVEDPSAYGVVQLDNEGYISGFVEKPDTFVSDLAIIGIYYIGNAAALEREMQYLLDNDIRDKGEYQLTNALDNLRQKGTRFSVGTVKEWLDCGNKDACVYTNQRVLHLRQARFASTTEKAKGENFLILPPCFIGKGVELKDCIVGPYASIGDNTKIQHSIVKNSIIQENASISGKIITNSMIGSHAHLKAKPDEYSLGDYSQI